MKYIDSHCHLYKFNEIEIKRILKNKDIIILSVSEDLESSLKNLVLSQLNENVIPAIGIHPWNIEKVNENTFKIIEDIIKDNKIKILGEIGLDKKFKPETFEKQKEIFEKFLNLAKEYDLNLNLHTPNASNEVYDLLIKYDIKKAYFHWYSGDEKLLEEIIDKGYFIGINVATIINEKYRKYIEIANIKNIITESDGPYNYKGIILHPDMLKDLYKLISDIRKINLEELSNIIQNNFARFIY
ncbi:TatD family deoxyribonuclease [Candidatus Nanobsidianus stetteri]|uniref:TatD family deoxyribonuclease n=1 Tax=Nanobsidianus stetteri TaxID=1294122 RepID=A0A2T9WUK3_NANST|nr:TatD family deoxyribonuclease [Candidatus Nanobsidianus stetteri]